MTKYYSLFQQDKKASIYIFGDVVEEEWYDSDVAANTLAQTIQGLDADEIDVHINSYGGVVSSGLAIYNMLRNHNAKVRTICDGFACSIASVIFMAGDERVMSNASLLMVHNAWQYTYGNAEQLRKAADDLDVITQASINAYMSGVNITEAELKKLLDDETWLLPTDALEKGFATSITADATTAGKAAASARKALQAIVKQRQIAQTATPPANPEEPPATPMLENKLNKFFEALTGRKE